LLHQAGVLICHCMMHGNMKFKLYKLYYIFPSVNVKLKEEAVARTVWRTRFGRGYGPVFRQQNE